MAGTPLSFNHCKNSRVVSPNLRTIPPSGWSPRKVKSKSKATNVSDKGNSLAPLSSLSLSFKNVSVRASIVMNSAFALFFASLISATDISIVEVVVAVVVVVVLVVLVVVVVTVVVVVAVFVVEVVVTVVVPVGMMLVVVIVVLAASPVPVIVVAVDTEEEVHCGVGENVPSGPHVTKSSTTTALHTTLFFSCSAAAATCGPVSSICLMAAQKSLMTKHFREAIASELQSLPWGGGCVPKSHEKETFWVLSEPIIRPSRPPTSAPSMRGTAIESAIHAIC
mmetsp:Transcript_53546/g.85143  ORF Transcript_53546/g.85143 Transcript_53546/m.85143 type:complete len:280 (-) Transcript_53546:56-895(-)